METRLWHLVHRALEAVEAAIHKGDVRAALAVLKGLGALAGEHPEIGSEDPEELAEEQQITQRERAAQRDLRRLTLL